MDILPQPPRERDAAFRRAGSSPDAVMVIHGFTSGPRSVLPWAEALADAGFPVSVPLLPGHGTRWEDLSRTPRDAWIAAVEREFDALQATHRSVFVCGLSMGGTLALRLAAARGVAGVVVANPALTFANPAARFAGLLHRVRPTVPAIANDIALPGQDEGAYALTPLAAVHQLGLLMAETRVLLPRIDAPVLAYRSAVDHVVPESSIAALRAGLASAPRQKRALQVRPLPNSYHVATLDHDAATLFSGTVDFIRSNGSIAHEEAHRG
ncbi:alpha/beta fold hydrolase [Arthrobacter ginkgonis]|uniref:Alpha/beta fold hydrolase n=1 Tax=Arthrobacter ginkgonis TaxID=1630594 RepID=A0ABP7C6S0_9MICC